MAKELPKEYKGLPVEGRKSGQRNQFEIIDTTQYMLTWRFGPAFVLDKWASWFNPDTRKWETRQAYRPSTDLHGAKYIHLQNCLDKIEKLRANPRVTMIKMVTLTPEYEWEKEEE